MGARHTADTRPQNRGGWGYFRERVKEPKVSENTRRFWLARKRNRKGWGRGPFGFRLQKSETAQLGLALGNSGSRENSLP